jgi:hypothetical protein
LKWVVGLGWLVGWLVDACIAGTLFFRAFENIGDWRILATGLYLLKKSIKQYTYDKVCAKNYR